MLLTKRPQYLFDVCGPVNFHPELPSSIHFFLFTNDKGLLVSFYNCLHVKMLAEHSFPFSATFNYPQAQKNL